MEAIYYYMTLKMNSLCQYAVPGCTCPLIPGGGVCMVHIYPRALQLKKEFIQPAGARN